MMDELKVMGRNIRAALNKLRRDQKGQAFVMALILLALGTVIAVPLLTYVSTGLKVGKVYDTKKNELYAADAGIEDAIWQIKYDQMPTGYKTYDYNTSWSAPISQQVNHKDVNVTINNIWIPKNVSVPDEATARGIIEANKLVVTGTTIQTGITLPGGTKISQYKIKVTYYPGAGENLSVGTLGIWLPRGYEYYKVPADPTYKSNLESFSTPYGSVPVVQDWAGNQAVLWSFGSAPLFSNFPNVTGTFPMTMNVTFYFEPLNQSQPDNKPDAVAWITTSGVSGIPYSWDADVKVFEMGSTAGSTTVNSYISKSEVRKLGAAISGDYRAVGYTLMQDTDHDSNGIRDLLLTQSNAIVNDIPSDAEVGAAFLYWSGWKSNTSITTVSPLIPDPCSNFNNWNNGSAWTISSGKFKGQYSSGTDSVRFLTLKSSLNLSSNPPYPPGTVFTVSWAQSKSGTLTSSDGLDFAFSGDGGNTWGSNIQDFRGNSPSSSFSYTIPGQYGTSSSFKMRFYLVGCSSPKYLTLDNITITAMQPDDSVIFKIDGSQVYFDGNGNPQIGATEIKASKNQVLPNFNSDGTSNGFSYSGYKDVTALVRAFSQKSPDPAINHPGNGTYTVGNVAGDTGNQWSYAGWSIIIIYTSVATQGHQLYLYDKFIYADNNTDIDFDSDGQYGGTVPGFIVPQQIPGEVNAATLTAFVGEGDACWSGDFLAFNAPATYWNKSPSNPNPNPWNIPDPDSAHPWKLWDGTSSTTSPPNNAQHPDNVWNSKSVGLSADGVDIDTFHVTWASGLLNQGDTSAHIDLPTNDDSWNLVYIILSFRSLTTTGGNINYLIR